MAAAKQETDLSSPCFSPALCATMWFHPFINNLLLWPDIYYKHRWSLGQWLSSLDGQCSAEKNTRGTFRHARSLSPPASLQEDVIFPSSLLSASCSRSFSFSVLNFIFSVALNTTKILPEIVLIAHEFCHIPQIFFLARVAQVDL